MSCPSILGETLSLWTLITKDTLIDLPFASGHLIVETLKGWSWQILEIRLRGHLSTVAIANGHYIDTFLRHTLGIFVPIFDIELTFTSNF